MLLLSTLLICLVSIVSPQGLYRYGYGYGYVPRVSPQGLYGYDPRMSPQGLYGYDPHMSPQNFGPIPFVQNLGPALQLGTGIASGVLQTIAYGLGAFPALLQRRIPYLQQPVPQQPPPEVDGPPEEPDGPPEEPPMPLNPQETVPEMDSSQPEAIQESEPPGGPSPNNIEMAPMPLRRQGPLPRSNHPMLKRERFPLASKRKRKTPMRKRERRPPRPKQRRRLPKPKQWRKSK
ncbi:unnamed protein product [Cylicocyclus nassatus]|uniref:Uncharacterized protein n=1 Tax=Cylicocyclus nassatus TaxID=53992 RepID=A0AA36GG85_CYLNA|nr:unnamed protein product [Cylicocyclus nassatus]